jgi:hypothetical protein
MLNGEYDDTVNDGLLNIDITATENINDINLRIRIALTESELFFSAPNGLEWHHQVMRDIIPYPYGIPIEIESGETISLSEPFSCPEPLVSGNCNLVVWVQSDATAEVLQAGRIKLNELSPTGINGDIAELPGKISLEQNYPNPFNAYTIISMDLPRPQAVKLNVYDIRGRLIQTLVNDIRDAGIHTVRFDSSDLSSGLYLYRLQTEDHDITRRMTLIK